MNNDEILIAIRNRLLADTTLTAMLSATGVVAEVANVASYPTVYPYISVNIVSNQHADAFDVDVVDVEVDVHLHFLTAAGTDPPTNALQRVYGNALSQAGRVPTYGLHRHILGSVGTSPYAFSAGLVWRSNQIEDHDEDHYHYIESYKFVMSKAG